MTDETSEATQAATTTVIVQNNTSNALGIASFIFGIISIFILAPIFVPLAILLGIIAVVKKQLVWGILGLFCALIGFVTSPILLGFLSLASIGVIQSGSDNQQFTRDEINRLQTMSVPEASVSQRSGKDVRTRTPVDKKNTDIARIERANRKWHIADEEVKPLIKAYYDAKGPLKGVFVMQSVEKIRLEKFNRDKTVAHVSYTYRCVVKKGCGNNPNVGKDQRRFWLVFNGNKWRVIKMGKYMSAQF